MSTLFITKKFYEKLITPDVQEILRLYSFSGRDGFLKTVCSFLNGKYPWLNIENVDIMSNEDASVYSMYNGFVKGSFSDYDEVTVSFSDIKTKEGNTIISQQLMPMLQSKISNKIDYLYDKRVKRIFLLTSHKTSSLRIESNSIKEDSRGSSLQLLVRCLVTLGFDVHPLIPVRNLEIGPCFSDVSDLIDNIEYIQSQNGSNLQHKNIELVGKTVVGSFAQKPKGQDEKYFAIRYITAIVLNNGNQYDVSQAYEISDRTAMMKMLYDFGNYVQVNNLKINQVSQMTDEQFNTLVSKEKEYQDWLKKMSEKFGHEGNREITATVRLAEVQRELRNRLISKHGQKCMLCDIENKEMLIASHIKNSSECDIFEKADTNNTFLLCANHDKLFDRYLISFNFLDGSIMISNELTEKELSLCNLDHDFKLSEDMMTVERQKYLMWHNDEFEKRNGNNN